MNLQQLTKEIINLQKKSEDWHAPINKVIQETFEKVNLNGYTWSDHEREVEEAYRKQLALYNFRQTAFPVREALLSFYETATDEDRAEVRRLIWSQSYIPRLLISYIYQCAECLESPEDSWILRSGLVAAAMENYAWGDFRDTDAALVELGSAAINAGIDIEPIAREVTPLCSPHKPGYMGTRRIIEDFQAFAKQAAANRVE